MSKCLRVIVGISFVVIISAGCGQEQTAPTVSMDGTKFLLTDEPQGAEDVITVREHAQDEDEIVIVGRIGGSVNPWVEGRAAFSIVDRSLKACSEIEGDNCPYPWDYCCERTKLSTSKVLVKIIDVDGNFVEADARELLKVKELQTVVIRGKAKRDDAGNLTVLAHSLYVKN